MLDLAVQEPIVLLRDAVGDLLPLDPWRWHQAATPAECDLLSRLRGPVLDIGCGPGRLVGELAGRGKVVLGVDPAPSAVHHAVQRGWPVLQRSVFQPLPGEGRWASILLIDGNIGIGGDPVRLLARCAQLLHPRGVIVAEVEPPSRVSRSCLARLERDGEASPWFPWAVLGADCVREVAGSAHLEVQSLDRTDEDRWFVHLIPRQAGRFDG